MNYNAHSYSIHVHTYNVYSKWLRSACSYIAFSNQLEHAWVSSSCNCIPIHQSTRWLLSTTEDPGMHTFLHRWIIRHCAYLIWALTRASRVGKARAAWLVPNTSPFAEISCIDVLMQRPNPALRTSSAPTLPLCISCALHVDQTYSMVSLHVNLFTNLTVANNMDSWWKEPICTQHLCVLRTLLL